METTGFRRLERAGPDLGQGGGGEGSGASYLGLVVFFSLLPNFQVKTGPIVSLADLVTGPLGLKSCRLRTGI